MGTIIRSRNLWITLLVSAFFWSVAPFIPRPHLFDFVNAFSIAGGIGVIVMYYPSVAKKTGSWLWIFQNQLSGPHYLVIGLMGWILYVVSRHIYNVSWRWMGKPLWMQDSLIVAFFIFFTIMIATMHLLSRDMEEGKIPTANWRWVGIFTAVGLTLTFLMIMFLDPFATL